MSKLSNKEEKKKVYWVSVISAIVLYNVFNTQSFLNLFKKLDIDIYKNK